MTEPQTPAPSADASSAPQAAPPTAPAPVVVPAAVPTAGLDFTKILLSVLIAVSIVAVWQGWTASQRVKNLERELVKRQQDSARAATEARLIATESQTAARDTVARTALLEARLAEVALQRGQLEDLIQSLSRSRDENLVVDIDASLRVAQQQAALTASAEPLVTALKSADDRIARTHQPRLDRVRRALARDLDRVKSVGLADTASLVIKLDEAIRLVDELPLVNDRLSNDDAPAAGPATAASANGKAAPGPAHAASAVAASSDWLNAEWLQWGRTAWDQVATAFWKETRSLIRVRRIEHPDAMLLSPEQGYFARENLKLRLLNARMALLSRQYSTAQNDLRSSQQALSRYFDAASRKTLLARDLVQQVLAQSVRADLPRLDETFAALSAVAAGR
ncbi:uroporphyrinogen-III C-methyltransferase [Aquabacterium sp.]|uniref:uroporphyrinogen-III C-methyltransferase n=1 Tax=Aquabacterium sp. TaxID=1872578 RepID=UPI0035B0DBDF